ncbi:MAG: hypothetical protein NE330_12300 [Lentisphaeraceae bacterium]|nr:hypothetical protein [Lentisphaeraceae bacterium]
MYKKGYILHCFSRYHDKKCLLYLIGRLENGQTFGIVEDRFKPYFYIRVSEKHRALKTISKWSASPHETKKKTMDGESLACLTLADPRSLKKLADELEDIKVRTYEADVKVEQRYLMDKGLRSFCEVKGNSIKGKGVDALYKNPDLVQTESTISLKSVIFEPYFEDQVFTSFALNSLPSKDENGQILVEYNSDNEVDVLIKLRDALIEIDPDVICAWRVQPNCFLPLKERFKLHNMPFDLGRHRPGKWFLEKNYRGRELSVLQGRQLLDIEQLMDHTWERYSESTPESIIKDVFDEDYPPETKYNCADRSLLLGRLLRKKNLVELTYSRSLLTGLQMERCWGSIASFEYLYMQELHKLDIVAPTLGIDRELRGGNPGGLVLEPHAGFHKNIFVFDFKSLYPSIIRTFNLDPLAYSRARQLAKVNKTEDLIHLPNGVLMDREKAILPKILKRFFASRETAKQNNDELASFIYKILMNSFFGVLGTSGCRFAQGPLVSSVSQSGHYLMRWTQSLLESQKCKVLYGDTDSLFVDLGTTGELSYEEAMSCGKEMQSYLNNALQKHIKEKFALESQLDLEFEKFYPHFFQPSMRGDDSKGRAKSYAALKATPEGNELEIIGLEAVRRDWTDFARDIQKALLQMIFSGEPAQKIETWLQSKVTDLKAGDLDDQLIYRKRLSKAPESYTSTTPPHVKAARLLDKVPRVIFYYMTKDGPQPRQNCTSSLDYQHYIDKQLEPIVKTLAQHYDFSWEKAILNQQTLF